MGTQGAVVITGASTGIGQACALRLDRLGFHVFAGVRKLADGSALKRRASERLTTVLIDVTDAASLAAAARTVDTSIGAAGLAGLVNNAGIVVAGALEFLPLSELRRQFEVNVIGQVATIQAFLPLLRRGHGRIVNMGSIEGLWATPFTGAYVASKFALEGLTDSLRMELRAWDMQVSIIEPGVIATPLWEKLQDATAALAEALPAQARDLYGLHFAAHHRAADKLAGAGISAEAVAHAVSRALVAKRPRTRYVVGREARIGAILARFLPDRLRDALTTRRLGLSIPRESTDPSPPHRT